jgi:predicted nuclease of predicted toxin-antitoxin system
MKFIVDAQLPATLSKFLTQKGFDIIHTEDLPNKERTTDREIRDISISENRIVITKDSDFLDSYYIVGVPQKLLLITTGNIKNKDLLVLFESNIYRIEELFKEYTFIEMNNIEIIGHE